MAAAFWQEPDFDDHELVELVRDRPSGLTAIVAIHSSHLGPAAGGTRFWHYPAGS
ncbi:MAG TPA: amino acid dehydrogenase, partial [Croceibacterium sp.]|nr:amino acid dehydrogenase [Croceibacterium sp.]